jgi:acetyltransferase-like isoleucine patch superfamily enzyme
MFQLGVNFKKAGFMLLELGLRGVIHPQWRAKLLRLFGANIGNNVRIYEVRFLNLSQGFKNLTVADDVHIGMGCYLDLEGEIYLGRGVTLSPNVTLLTHSDAGSFHHSPLCEIFPPKIAKVCIDEYCWIGSHVTILAGVHIHEKTVVGAGSVVLHDLSAHGLYAGVPAKKIKEI